MQDQGIDKEELSRIAETVRGDAASYGYIVDKYKDCIYGLCLKMTGSRHEADDLTQEIFLKSFKNLKQYSVQYKFINWLYEFTPAMIFSMYSITNAAQMPTSNDAKKAIITICFR